MTCGNTKGLNIQNEMPHNRRELSGKGSGRPGKEVGQGTSRSDKN